jgi:DeoR/GlpR family transcriptional regulator of sugar metabolism
MMIHSRHNQILDWLQTEKTISAAALSERLHVSNMTIWRDLKQLEQQGLLKRVHGGAAAIPQNLSGSSLHASFQLNPAVFSPIKTKLGRYAAHFLVEENDNIVLEGGTTVTSMVPYIDQANITILTNGLNTMLLAAPLIDSKRVLCCGGVLSKYADSFLGPQAEAFFSEFRVEKVFLSASGVTLEDEFTDPEPLYAPLKHAMRRSAEKVVVLVDSSKFGKRTLNQVLRFSEVDILVTDSGAPQDMLDAIAARGIEVHIAP